ncbi:hypothetical protein CsSME_00050242 [Camellia sinensis var. sinensis]
MNYEQIAELLNGIAERFVIEEGPTAPGKKPLSSAPVELTEAETEYAVNAVQHIFDRHVVFQYNCTNSIPEQLLENVTVVVDASDTEKFTEVSTRPLRSLPYDSPGQTFVVFEKPEGVPQLENSRTC